MVQEYFVTIAQGIPTSLLLTVVALVIAFFLAILFTFLLALGNPIIKKIIGVYITLLAVLVNFNGL